MEELKNIDFLAFGIVCAKIILYLVLARILIGITNKSIDKMAKVSVKFKSNPGRTATLTSLMKSIVKYVIYIFVGILPILYALKFPIQSLLAVAGLGGVAVGFGAQSLVKDIVTGFFILFEDQYNVDDYVDISGMKGTVEGVELRTTKLRGYGGELYIIPNGEVKTVINYSRGNSTAVIDVSVAYESNINRAMNIMESVAKNYKDEHETVAEGPTMLGVTELGTSGLNIRMSLKTSPMMHYQVERDIRKEIKQAFDKEGVEIPYHKINLVSKNK